MHNISPKNGTLIIVEATVALKYLLDLEFPCKKMSLTQKRPGIFITKKKNGLKYFYTIKINSLE